MAEASAKGGPGYLCAWTTSAQGNVSLVLHEVLSFMDLGTETIRFGEESILRDDSDEKSEQARP